jgi:glutathione S-transferase
MLWALRQHDPYNWLDNEEDALTLMAQCDGDFKFHLDRYKYPTRYDNCSAAEHRLKAAVFLDIVNSNLQESTQKCYEFRSDIGIYYAGCMPFFRQFSNTDKSWFAAQPWLYLQSVLENFEKSDEFKTIMQTHPQWRPG